MKFQLARGRTPCPPPLGYAYVPSEKNKKGVRKFSARFLAFSNEISTVQKIVLSSSRGQANFRGLEASRPRPRPRTWPSRPRPRLRTSKCVLEAKDVLEDSTSGLHCLILWTKTLQFSVKIFFYSFWSLLDFGDGKTWYPQKNFSFAFRMCLVKAAKASPHAKFYSLSTGYNQMWKFGYCQ